MSRLDWLGVRQLLLFSADFNFAELTKYAMNEYSLLIGFVNALLMIIGIGGLGSIIIRLTLKVLSNKFSYIFSGGEILIGAIFLSTSISWISLFFSGYIVYQTFAVLLFTVGILTITKIVIGVKNYNLYGMIFKTIPRLDLVLLILLPLFYIFSNSGDITNADSIDYHIGYGLNYLKPNFDPHPEWYNGRMASIGEKINAIGLSVYSQQFGPLLQIAGYISIGYMLVGACGDKFNNKYLLLLALLSSPVFLFLGTSAKPQILPTALSCFSFYLIHSLEKFNETLTRDKLIIIVISLLLSSVAFTHKFSFIISYILISIYIFWICKKTEIKFLHCVALIVLVSLFVISPAFYDKYIRYGSNLFEYFLNPVSSSETSLKYFIETARQYRESSFIFPIYLFIPDSLGKISTILGFGVFIAAIPLFLSGVISNFLKVLISLNIALLVLFSMPSSRFFLETYIWLLIALGSSGYLFGLTLIKFLRVMVSLQSVLVIVSLIPISFYAFGQILGFGGDSFKVRFVNGYNLYEWYSEKLTLHEPILLDHRSRSLTDRDVVSLEAHEFSKNNVHNYQILSSQLIKYNVQHVVTVDKSKSFDEIVKCSTNRLFGPEKLRISTRNPFNSGYENGYIFSIDPIPFVECLKRQ